MPVSEVIRSAKGHLARRRYSEAEAVATRAIDRDPYSATAFLVRAEARRKLLDHDAALADLAHATHLAPDRPTAYVIRAEILKRRCQFRLAIDDANRALTLDPNNVAAHAIRAECRRAIGDEAGAAEDELELFRIDPTRHAPPPETASPIVRAAVDPLESRKKHRDTRKTANDGISADDAPDRSWKTRVLMHVDEAAELMAAASGYKPDVVPLARLRPDDGGTVPGGSLPFVPW